MSKADVQARTLIITEPEDAHADAVAWALRQLGHGCDIWVPLASNRKTLGFEISDAQGALIDFRCGGPRRPISAYTSVWFRRSFFGTIPEGLSAADEAFLHEETSYFVRGMRAAFQGARLVANSPSAMSLAELKLFQLLAAREAGLPIPPTLFSNDPGIVSKFIGSFPNGSIYKSHTPGVWKGEDATLGLFTSSLTQEDLDGIDPRRFNPGIFQEKIEKDFEIRITIFGRTCISVRLDNQNPTDWRIDQWEMSVSQYDLPEAIREKIFVFMEAMGLVMGMIDMIVTPSGDHVFLEVNHQGQFLWVEQFAPECRVLQAFARFLISADPLFEWDSSEATAVTMSDYDQSEQKKRFVRQRKKLNALAAAQ